MKDSSNFKQKAQQNIQKQDIGLLLLWVGIGALLRFSNLTLKSVWGDEWATLVFSLGHGFRDIPLDQLLNLDTLIQPLRYDATVPIQAVTDKLFSESNHPPLYYWLTHFWLDLWSNNGEFISIRMGRSPAAFFGVLLIPITFAFGWFHLRQRVTAHLGAIAMTVSPYAIYLSQEARHYTLAMIWMTLSYWCVAAIIRDQQQQKKTSLALLLSWVIVNSFGIASHYFMLLCLFSEGLVLLYFYGEEITNCWQKLPEFKKILPSHWRRIILGGIASGLSILILMSQWQSNSDGELTSWLNQDYGWSFEALVPPLRSLGWLLGMIFMLPLEADQTWLVISSAIAILIVLIWFIPKIIVALKNLWSELETRIFSGLIIANLCTILGITYILKLDLTLAPRYHFIYFPALMILLGIVLNYFWQQTKNSLNIWRQKNKTTAFIILAVMFVSAISVNLDLAYRKPENSQAIAQIILQNSGDYPTILGTHYYEIAVTRTQMGLAWELHHADPSFQPKFLLLDDFYEQNLAPQVLDQVVSQLSEPTEILMFNTHFVPPQDRCEYLANVDQRVTGYSYRKHLCRP